jgi:hypothetical protein
MPAKVIDLTNQRFGWLTVTKQAGIDAHRNAIWQCLCACGSTHTANGQHLRNGTTKSCGCKKVFLARKRFARPRHGRITSFPDYADL